MDDERRQAILSRSYALLSRADEPYQPAEGHWRIPEQVPERQEPEPNFAQQASAWAAEVDRRIAEHGDAVVDGIGAAVGQIRRGIEDDFRVQLDRLRSDLEQQLGQLRADLATEIGAVRELVSNLAADLESTRSIVSGIRAGRVTNMRPTDAA